MTRDNVLHVNISTPSRQMHGVETVDHMHAAIVCCQQLRLIIIHDNCAMRLQVFGVTKSTLHCTYEGSMPLNSEYDVGTLL